MAQNQLAQVQLKCSWPEVLLGSIRAIGGIFRIFAKFCKTREDRKKLKASAMDLS